VFVRRDDEVCRAFHDWLTEHWNRGLSLRQWRQELIDSGWGRPSWPHSWYGRGLPRRFDTLIEGELLRHGAVGLAFGPGALLAGPTILEHGSDEVRQRLLLPLLNGTERWCQLFSEPDAGSDLASLRTHAVRDRGRWIINGQKVWSSSAHHAERGMLLARTGGGTNTRHAGLTYFALDMQQPGIEVRPIRQMNGHASFNEVFLVDVVANDGDVVGEVGDGWAVARTTLAHERRFNPARRHIPKGARGRAVEQARAEAREAMAAYTWYPQRSGRSDLLVRYAHAAHQAADPLVRQAVARAIGLARCSEWMVARAQTARAAGRSPGPEGSLGKLMGSVVARAAADAHGLIAGLGGQLQGDDAQHPLVAEILTSVPAISIAGGTDEIQKNIVAEHILGLPREVPAQTPEKGTDGD
jgi:alkylation response protein AidB-like acyl-CoA dehydrogenase